MNKPLLEEEQKVISSYSEDAVLVKVRQPLADEFKIPSMSSESEPNPDSESISGPVSESVPGSMSSAEAEVEAVVDQEQEQEPG